MLVIVAEAKRIAASSVSDSKNEWGAINRSRSTKIISFSASHSDSLPKLHAKNENIRAPKIGNSRWAPGLPRRFRKNLSFASKLSIFGSVDRSQRRRNKQRTRCNLVKVDQGNPFEPQRFRRNFESPGGGFQARPGDGFRMRITGGIRANTQLKRSKSFPIEQR